jgi:hypothetical protein
MYLRKNKRMEKLLLQHLTNFIPSNAVHVILSDMIWACHDAYMGEIIKANKNVV